MNEQEHLLKALDYVERCIRLKANMHMRRDRILADKFPKSSLKWLRRIVERDNHKIVESLPRFVDLRFEQRVHLQWNWLRLGSARIRAFCPGGVGGKDATPNIVIDLADLPARRLPKRIRELTDFVRLSHEYDKRPVRLHELYWWADRAASKGHDWDEDKIRECL